MRVFLMRIRLPRTERSIFIRIGHELYCLEIMNYIIYQLRDLEIIVQYFMQNLRQV